MKQRIITIFSLSLLAILSLTGCSGNSDGPSFSDDELLKRGKAGHDAAAGAAKPPAGVPAAPSQGQGR